MFGRYAPRQLGDMIGRGRNQVGGYNGPDFGPGRGMMYPANMPRDGYKFIYDRNGGRHEVPIEQGMPSLDPREPQNAMEIMDNSDPQGEAEARDFVQRQLAGPAGGILGSAIARLFR